MVVGPQNHFGTLEVRPSERHLRSNSCARGFGPRDAGTPMCTSMTLTRHWRLKRPGRNKHEREPVYARNRYQFFTDCCCHTGFLPWSAVGGCPVLRRISAASAASAALQRSGRDRPAIAPVSVREGDRGGCGSGHGDSIASRGGQSGRISGRRNGITCSSRGIDPGVSGWGSIDSLRGTWCRPFAGRSSPRLWNDVSHGGGCPHGELVELVGTQP